MSANAETQPVMRAMGVRKAYGPRGAETTVLRGDIDENGRDLGVNLDVYGGELTVLTGESGSGKTSLLLALAAISRVDGDIYHRGPEGEVNVAQLGDRRSLLRRRNGPTRTQWRRENTGIVMQDSALVPDLTAWENIVIPSQLEGKSVDDERLRAVCEGLQIKEALGKRAFELSGGQQQRVAIARALARAPLAQAMQGSEAPNFMIFADEPTGALDSENTEIVHELFKEKIVSGLGITAVVVSHDESVGKYADRIIGMRDGQIVSDERA